MDDHEQIQSAAEYSHAQEQHTEAYDDSCEKIHGAEDYDYNREPPLDSATASSNRQRSKYVFMTLCFLLALILFYTYITSASAGNTDNWFPLLGAIALGIMGIVFLRSPDNAPGSQPAAENITTAPIDGEIQAQAKKLSPFEELVQEALATIPEEFHEKMENVMVRVEYEPDEETRTRVGIQEGYTLLGLYEGVPLTTYGRDSAPYPEIITIYQHSIEEYCRHNPTRIREQVRTTVLHEIAHHFGMGHEEMPIWVK
jgi:predicted Zn-dependent protease with MMP-like domain